NQSQELDRFYELIHFNGFLLSKLRYQPSHRYIAIDQGQGFKPVDAFSRVNDFLHPEFSTTGQPLMFSTRSTTMRRLLESSFLSFVSFCENKIVLDPVLPPERYGPCNS